MRSVVLGTAGHVDHGKTALIEALTGVNTDRWEEERARGITIDLGFARYPTESPDLDISVIDVPGHEDFVKNMLAGATGIDVLLLVIAADEGPMPQTREHLWIARLLGVRRGVVALTKVDLVDEEWLELVSEAVRSELSSVLGKADWPILPVSATAGRGLEDLHEHVVRAATDVDARSDDDVFRAPIDRAFTVKGVGTVVTGTIWSGSVKVGDEVQLLPGGRRVRVRGVQIHGADVEDGRAGQRAALALVGLELDDVGRGDVLVGSDVWRASQVLDVELRIIPDSPWRLHHWSRVRLHLGTSETMARLVTNHDDEAIQAGSSVRAQLRLEAPIVARAGDRFVIRFYSPVTTVGGGVVLDPWAVRRSRRRQLELGDREEPGPVRSILATRDKAGAFEAELTLLTGLRPVEVSRELRSLEADGLACAIGGRWYRSSVTERVRAEVLAELQALHQADPHAQGASLELIRSRLGLRHALVNAAIADLAREDLVRVDGSVAALAQHRAHLSEGQQPVADAVLERLEAGGSMPPTVKELARELGIRGADLNPVLEYLTDSGRLTSVTPDLVYPNSALEGIESAVRSFLAERRSAQPSEFREVLAVSRKYLIPLLEYLDEQGVTRRTESGRELR